MLFGSFWLCVHVLSFYNSFVSFCFLFLYHLCIVVVDHVFVVVRIYSYMVTPFVVLHLSAMIVLQFMLGRLCIKLY